MRFIKKERDFKVWVSLSSFIDSVNKNKFIGGYKRHRDKETLIHGLSVERWDGEWLMDLLEKQSVLSHTVFFVFNTVTLDVEKKNLFKPSSFRRL